MRLALFILTFWAQPQVERISLTQFKIWKAHYCYHEKIGANQVYISLLLDALNLK